MMKKATDETATASLQSSSPEHPATTSPRSSRRSPTTGHHLSEEGRIGRRFPGKILLWIAASSAVIALLFWSGGPNLMATELTERLEEKLDLDLDLSAVELGSNAVELREVEIRSPRGELVLTIERMRVIGNTLTIARQEANSVEGIRLEGAHCTIDLDHPAAAERIAAIRRALSSSPTGGEPAEESGVDASSETTLESLGLDRVLAYLSDDAVIELDGAIIDLVEDGRSERYLEIADSRLIRRGELSFDLMGRAEHFGGSVDWHLETHLDAPSFDGRITWQDLPAHPTLGRLQSLPILDATDLRSTGSGYVAANSAGRLTFVGQAELDGLVLDHERLSPHPLRDLSGRFEGAATLDWLNSALEISDARLLRRDVETVLRATAARADGAWHVALEATLPETPCQQVIDAIPGSLIGAFSKTSIHGTMDGHVTLAIDSSQPKATELDIDVSDGCRFESIPALGDPDRLRNAFTQVTRGHDGEVVHTFETGPGSESWTPIEDVSPFFLQAVLAHEDASFFDHSGFAVFAMENALRQNLSRERAAFGASTLSMQLAKNLFLTRDKHLARKSQEVLATWWLERHFDKKEILELYVNVVEFGPQIFGIRQAAEHYFARRPLDLTPAESVFLSTLLPAPVPRSEQFQEGLWSATESEMNFLLRHMHRKGRIDEIALRHGLHQIESFRFASAGDPRYLSVSTAEYTPREDLGEPGSLPFETNYVRYREPASPEMIFVSGLEHDRSSWLSETS